ncbi:helix-turn-helix protein [Haloactinopolyspora alba]|uniref:Helix-turn-helix protein n=1 Tax=Haloactinopolyspora alba TaxID=648780 RepID=A0A2P8E0C7_9ACTN|nr:helix-turn-helix transcriptional regulator [Haloactinopolyspora alba]PSL02867.1 helix-turn-helix protein [Haloactinopolyspora alba]
MNNDQAGPGPMGEEFAEPSAVLVDQLPKIRARRELSAEGLAQRIAELGGKLDRAAISKIENRSRGVSLDEALILAVALDVAPVHLFTPHIDEDRVWVAPTLRVPPYRMRQWVRGGNPLPGRPDREFRTEVPDSEWRSKDLEKKHLQAVEDFNRASRRQRVARAMVDTLTSELAELEDYRNVIGVMENRPQIQRLEKRLGTAYEELAEAKVDSEDALRKLNRLAHMMQHESPNADIEQAAAAANRSLQETGSTTSDEDGRDHGDN